MSNPTVHLTELFTNVPLPEGASHVYATNGIPDMGSYNTFSVTSPDGNAYITYENFWSGGRPQCKVTNNGAATTYNLIAMAVTPS